MKHRTEIREVSLRDGRLDPKRISPTALAERHGYDIANGLIWFYLGCLDCQWCDSTTHPTRQLAQQARHAEAE